MKRLYQSTLDETKADASANDTSLATSARVVKLRRRRSGEIVQGCDVYIGRQLAMGGWNLARSDWANPFSVRQCDGSAVEAVRRYDEWIRHGDGRHLLPRIGELRGKVLGCWCKKSPNDPCHGDVLVQLLREQEQCADDASGTAPTAVRRQSSVEQTQRQDDDELLSSCSLDATNVDNDYQQALAFVRENHAPDLAWIRSRRSLVETFDEFYREYCYVVLASGFRARTAANLLNDIVAAEGDYERMQRVFNNGVKCRHMCSMYGQREQWTTLRQSLTNVDSLERLPYIGPVTKYHLARNIGLSSRVAKPDVHLVRYVRERLGDEQHSVQSLIERLASRHGETEGVVDFVLWAWLSHEKGRLRPDCCGDDSAIRLR